MKASNQVAGPPMTTDSSSITTKHRLVFPRILVIASLALATCFAIPLYHWAHFTYNSELYSYALLIPLVSAYLFNLNIAARPSAQIGFRTWPIAFFLGAIGLISLAVFWYMVLSGSKLARQDSVALMTVAFVLLLASIFTFGLKPSQLRAAAFPLGFLLFMAPFPIAMEQAIERFLQHGSAPPAYWLFQLVGTPVFRDDLVFQLPNMTLQIAPECSGIRSTLVLFMTSLVAGQIFLRSPGKRALLTFAVIPLALIRNGFRVFTIGQLCVQIGPHMIDSFVHHRGGPIFFALSLIPFFALVYFLVRSDRRALQTRASTKAV